MSDQFLDFLLPGFTITNFQLQTEAITLTARASSITSACPNCGGFSNRVHSYYIRHPKDLPLVGSSLFNVNKKGSSATSLYHRLKTCLLCIG
jgi:hypothetical protein